MHGLNQGVMEEGRFTLLDEDTIWFQHTTGLLIEWSGEQTLCWADWIRAVNDQDIQRLIGLTVYPGDAIIEQELATWVIIAATQIWKELLGHASDPFINLDLNSALDIVMLQYLPERAAIAPADDGY